MPCCGARCARTARRRLKTFPCPTAARAWSTRLYTAGAGRRIAVEVSGPLGAPVTAEYAVLDGGTAVIEMSAASGLTLIPEAARDPMRASTYGTES